MHHADIIISWERLADMPGNAIKLLELHPVAIASKGYIDQHGSAPWDLLASYSAPESLGLAGLVCRHGRATGLCKGPCSKTQMSFCAAARGQCNCRLVAFD